MGDPQIKAVLWDFGGVITTSPFEAFAAYESANSLPAGFLRRLNATNPDTNAWARLERSEVTAEEFAELFEAEARAAGGEVRATEVLAGLRGRIRPEMVEAVRRCHQVFRTGLLTNNFVAPADGDSMSAPTDPLHTEVLEHFDVVVESSKAGFRKPDPRFYERACELLGIEAHEAVFLDDLGINLKPARALGMRTIKVESSGQALAELEAVVGIELS